MRSSTGAHHEQLSKIRFCISRSTTQIRHTFETAPVPPQKQLKCLREPGTYSNYNDRALCNKGAEIKKTMNWALTVLAFLSCFYKNVIFRKFYIQQKSKARDCLVS